MNKEKILAEKLINYSLNTKSKDKILITYQSIKCINLVKYLIEEANKIGAICHSVYDDVELSNYHKMLTTDDRINLIAKYKEFELNNFDAFINIKYNLNDFEGKNVPDEITREILERTYKTHNKLVNERRWVLLNYPSAVDAYKASMTLEDFYNYSMDVMNVDYATMSKDILPLKRLMEKTDKVHIVGPKTDITFSIKGMPAIPCVGNSNIPDGEIYTAPVKNSVNGIITYNTSSTYRGEVFHNISLEFKDGKIINVKSDDNNKQDKLLEIFQTDEGARYVGEFSFGVNPMIYNAMGDILFDEKIIGSIHFTPGAAYKDCYNGNDSNIHWDLVLIQRKEYGGGEIYFDDKLVRKDGIFVLKELEKLNYNLKKPI
ncbi:MAG: aminopeptidase [bacterium]|nr:aminopeptidase [bacterium]